MEAEVAGDDAVGYARMPAWRLCHVSRSVTPTNTLVPPRGDLSCRSTLTSSRSHRLPWQTAPPERGPSTYRRPASRLSHQPGPLQVVVSNREGGRGELLGSLGQLVVPVGRKAETFDTLRCGDHGRPRRMSAAGEDDDVGRGWRHRR